MSRFRARVVWTAASAALVAFGGCASQSQLTVKPIKWTDPDNRSIRLPREIEENQYWDDLRYRVTVPRFCHLSPGVV